MPLPTTDRSKMATGHLPVVQENRSTSGQGTGPNVPLHSETCSSCGKPLETGWVLAVGNMGGTHIDWVPASVDPHKWRHKGREKLAGEVPRTRTEPLKALRCPTCRRVTFRY